MEIESPSPRFKNVSRAAVSDICSPHETCWTVDPSVDAWYFHLHRDDRTDPPAHRTEDIGQRRVLIDWDERGNVIGVEVL